MVRLHLNLTVKKSFHPTKKGTDDVQLARFEYWHLIRLIPAQELIFLDESGINLALVRECARSEKGNRAYGARPIRAKNVSVVAAISLKDGLLAQWSMLGYMDALTFDAFISQRLVPKLWKGTVVLMDNCSIYKSDEIEALITDAGATLIYLPTYSPDFSPIENCWSKIKSILRTIAARSYPDLLKTLEEAFAKVTQEDLLGWFTHCGYCTQEDWETLLQKA